MRNKLLTLLLFSSLLFGVCIFIIPQKENSNLERRSLHINKEITSNNFISMSELVLKDQFPLRDLSIKLINSIQKISNIPFGYRLLKIKDGVVSLNKDIYVNEYIKLNENDKNTALNKAYNIKTISERYPNIKTYLYFPTRLEETSVLDNANSISYYPQLKDEFLAQLNNKIKIGSLTINDVEDHTNYFYKTDSHWNGKGAYQGYKDIITMIKNDFNIEEPKNVSFEECSYDFYGKFGANLAYLCKPEHIILINKNLKAFDYYINNKKSVDNTEERYKNEGKGDVAYSDYDVAFGDNALIREYDFHQEDKPNLLIFADSFVNPVKDLIASHFNKTVIIDMRADDGSFNLDKTIKDNNIDAILFLQCAENLYFNGYLFVPLD